MHRTKAIFLKCFLTDKNNTSAHRKMYSDQTGRFPYKSYSGNQYLLVLYGYDSNGIVSEALKLCQSKELVTAFKKYYTKIKAHIKIHNLFILDNIDIGYYDHLFNNIMFLLQFLQKVLRTYVKIKVCYTLNIF